MSFPDKLTQDEMSLRVKEWLLMGLTLWAGYKPEDFGGTFRMNLPQDLTGLRSLRIYPEGARTGRVQDRVAQYEFDFTDNCWRRYEFS